MRDEGLGLISVHKAELIDRIRLNRDQHRAVFEKAIQGYHDELKRELADRLDRLIKGQHIDKHIALLEPEDHTEDYDRVLDMLEMSVDDEVTITAQEFAQYVRDDWAWKRQWVATNSAYLVQ